MVDFLKRPNPAVIAFIRPDGFPMSVATWYDWEDGLILVNMHEGRSRLRWLRANPKASLTALGGVHRELAPPGPMPRGGTSPLRETIGIDTSACSERWPGSPTTRLWRT